MTGPRGTTPFAENDATCHNTIRPDVSQSKTATSLCHVIVRPPRQRTVMPCQHLYGLYGLPSQRPFFTCLTIQTDRDISRSRCPFEMK
jgi:hypothetical protein